MISRFRILRTNSCAICRRVVHVSPQRNQWSRLCAFIQSIVESRRFGNTSRYVYRVEDGLPATIVLHSSCRVWRAGSSPRTAQRAGSSNRYRNVNFESSISGLHALNANDEWNLPFLQRITATVVPAAISELNSRHCCRDGRSCRKESRRVKAVVRIGRDGRGVSELQK